MVFLRRCVSLLQRVPVITAGSRSAADPAASVEPWGAGFTITKRLAEMMKRDERVRRGPAAARVARDPGIPVIGLSVAGSGVPRP
jgi:hypothetical protein